MNVNEFQSFVNYTISSAQIMNKGSIIVINNVKHFLSIILTSQAKSYCVTFYF